MGSPSRSDGSARSAQDPKPPEEGDEAKARSSASSPMREDGETDGDDRVVRVSNLTRIVNHKHLEEIFAHYGAVERVALERFRPDKGDENGGDTSNLRAGFVQYVRAGDATNAMSHMDGGQIDGKEVTLIRIAAVPREAHATQRTQQRPRAPSKSSAGESRGQPGKAETMDVTERLPSMHAVAAAATANSTSPAADAADAAGTTGAPDARAATRKGTGALIATETREIHAVRAAAVGPIPRHVAWTPEPAADRSTTEAGTTHAMAAAGPGDGGPADAEASTRTAAGLLRGTTVAGLRLAAAVVTGTGTGTRGSGAGAVGTAGVAGGVTRGRTRAGRGRGPGAPGPGAGAGAGAGVGVGAAAAAGGWAGAGGAGRRRRPTGAVGAGAGVVRRRRAAAGARGGDAGEAPARHRAEK